MYWVSNPHFRLAKIFYLGCLFPNSTGQTQPVLQSHCPYSYSNLQSDPNAAPEQNIAEVVTDVPIKIAQQQPPQQRTRS